MTIFYLFKHDILTYDALKKAAHDLVNENHHPVLVRSEAIEDSIFSQDYWTDGHESFWLANIRNKQASLQDIDLTKTIKTYLNEGHTAKDAIVAAKMQELNSLPYLAAQPLVKIPQSFTSCPLGLYPIVDSSQWVEKIAPLGVACIQLRIKNPKNDFEKEIKKSIVAAKKYGIPLFVNDYWQEAIDLGADGIHLGQEDLDTADIEKIFDAGLYLGISTRCHWEVARAHRFRPSYIACGPIFYTTSKEMAFAPQGLENLAYWRRTLSYPLVAVGGINLTNLAEVLATGVKGISVISAITQAIDPVEAIHHFSRLINT